MNALIVSPLLIPLATLVATLLARRSPRAVTALSLAGALAYLGIPLPTGRPIPVPVMCQGQERTVQLAGLRTHEQTTEAP